jgi:DNA-directed RNA polymerase subunit beta
MNVGQILETHLGLAARGLGIQIDQAIEKKWSPDKLREQLKQVFDSPRVRDVIDTFDDEQVVDVARRTRGGVHTATAVFDGARESEVKDLLESAGMPRSGQAVLYDGRSGDVFG